MPRRWTITEKWDDKWFLRLSPLAKNLWEYIRDKCDCAGFWEIDLDWAAKHIKTQEKKLAVALQEFNEKVVIHDGWLWIRKFIFHQRNYPLNPENNSHKGILYRLQLHSNFGIDFEKEMLKQVNFEAPNEGLISPYSKGKGKSKGNGKGKRFIPPALSEVQAYIRENNYDVNAAEFIKYYTSSDPPWHDQNGKPVYSWKQKLIAVWAKKPKAKKCIHCGKLGVYFKKDDTENPYWLCEDHKPIQKPLPKKTPVPQMKKVPGGVDINNARNKNLDALGVK